MQFFDDYFDEISARIRDVDRVALDQLSGLFQKTRDQGRKVILAGNGGSAAMASHVSVDLTKVGRIRAINFNEADLLTCFANDFGYEFWVEKAVESYADSGDCLVLISSSGRSANIVNAGKAARGRGLRLVTLSGFDADNPLRTLGELNFWVNSHSYNVVELTHQAWLLATVDNLVSGRGGHG